MKLRRKAVRRRAVRVSLLLSNVVVLGVILTFVLQNPSSDSLSAPVLSATDTGAVANPLDQVSSADIALTVARLGSLPETTAINNQAQSQAADVAIAASSNNVINKPQVVATALKSSADIQDYTVLAGETISTIATKFGVTSDSIRWSNNITGDTVAAGTKLSIPPVNGIVYTVNNGDTPDSLAAKFRANKDKIIAYNDAEIKGLTVGRRIIIPDGAQVAATNNYRAATQGSFAWGITPVYGSNGYDYGYCTWYVANRLPVPSNWGNANTWAYYAPASGWTVSKRPVAGAVAQTTGPGYGHVAVVNEVSEDGSMIKYSDMNGLAGWGRVGTSANWVPASKFNNYIYR
ncbi:MAG: LysM peptidoglycan-binding domain-containing protein [Patescibacteria group bacterium]